MTMTGLAMVLAGTVGAVAVAYAIAWIVARG